MKTYFIRHKENKKNLEASRKEIIELFDTRRIAIFFDNEPWETVFDEINEKPHSLYFTSEYCKDKMNSSKGYKTALKAMNSLSKDGGYVFAEYCSSYIGEEKKSGCILGKISPNSKIERFNSNCGSLISEVSLQLDSSNIKTINYFEYPVLFAIRPPYGTICCPNRNTYSSIAENLFEGKNLELSCNLLHPKMVEQMCVEYLYQVGLDVQNENLKLDYCSLKPGKTLAQLDIVGRLKNGQKIFGQVKNDDSSNQLHSEEYFFKHISPEIIGVFFSRFDKDIEVIGTNTFKINIDMIFKYFKDKKPILIKDMIGIDN